MSALEKTLNATYRACGYMASAFITLIVVSVVINVFDRIVGSYTAGTNEFAAYCVGAAGALGLAYTYGQNRHIKMTMLVNKTSGRLRRTLDLISLSIAVVLSSFVSFFVLKMVIVSAMLEDRSTGTDGILLWIPQVPMAFGFIVFSVCLAHALLLELFPAMRSDKS